MPISGDILLRLIRATDLEQQPSPRVVGIDNWARRRGKRYGTIIRDLERGHVIDIVQRSAEVVADWLHQHPGVEVIARDRAGAYAKGARRGAPAALQVADRWRLLHNLGDTLQAAVDRNRRAVRQAAQAVVQGESLAPEEMMPSTYSTEETRRRAERRDQRHARHEKLHRLHLSGLSNEAIAIVVRRWLKAGGPPAHSKPRQPQPLDAHIPVLEDRWREGCRNASRLWRELRQGGFTGSRRPVARWVARHRHEDPPPHAAEVRRAAAWPVPSSRRYTRWLTMSLDTMNAQEGVFIRHLAELAPGLTQAGELATDFAALIKKT